VSGVFNLRGGELPPAQRPGDEHRYRQRSLGRERGAKHASWSVYELPPGERATAYHYELNREEWILVIAGEATVRGPEGERVLRAGDVACFPIGPAGAHTVANRADVPTRYAMLSTVPDAGFAVVYPDSNRVAVVGEGLKVKMELAEDRPYWEGER
jgi:uncharacterized cupin superfamily protein